MSNNRVCSQAALLPTVLGVSLFSIGSVLLSVKSISVVRQSLYMYKNYMRCKTGGLSLCITDPQDWVKPKIFMIGGLMKYMIMICLL